MNLMKYQAFVKVAELKSITKAAQAMGYSQPGISHMLDSLEKEVGFPLLVRSKESIRTTTEGEQLLYYCRQMMKYADEFQNTVASMNGLLSGSIRIGAYTSALLSFVPALIARFSRAYSKIDISVREYSHAELQKRLVDGTIDLAVMSSPLPVKYEFHPLFDDAFCAVMSETHPFVSSDKISVKMLNGCDLIMPLAGCDDIVNHIMEEHPFAPNITFYTSSDAAGIAMAKENLGLYITSKQQTDRLPAGTAAREFEEGLHRSVGICLKSLKHAAPAVKEFVKMANQEK